MLDLFKVIVELNIVTEAVLRPKSWRVEVKEALEVPRPVAEDGHATLLSFVFIRWPYSRRWLSGGTGPS
jgi:hypothetical protein